jgi:hypothetical protein
LPPVQQGCEFDSLDAAGNSETQEQPVEMSLDSTPCHFELASDLGVVTTLQKQFNNLLFARTEPNGLLLHPNPPLVEKITFRPSRRMADLSKSRSIRLAILRLWGL